MRRAGRPLAAPGGMRPDARARGGVLGEHQAARGHGRGRAVPVPAPEDLLRRLRELRGAPLRRALLVRPPRVQGEPGGC